MARFRGNVGFVKMVEDPARPGIFAESVTIYKRTGDILSTSWKTGNGTSQNDDFTINNRISVIANSEMQKNRQYARWIEVDGAKWEISDVSIEPPRLIFTLGGLYNAHQSRT